MSIAERLATEPIAIPRPATTAPFTRIDTFDKALTAPGGFGARLRACRAAALDFRREFATSGSPDSVRTHDLISLPYPTRYGLFRAAISPTPFVTISNRMLIVRWTESDGSPRILLFEPSDHELDSYTPHFAELQRYTPGPLRNLFVRAHTDVLTACRRAGIDPAEVDYLAFDHLHTQDVRRWLGTPARNPTSARTSQYQRPSRTPDCSPSATNWRPWPPAPVPAALVSADHLRRPTAGADPAAGRQRAARPRRCADRHTRPRHGQSEPGAQYRHRYLGDQRKRHRHRMSHPGELPYPRPRAHRPIVGTRGRAQRQHPRNHLRAVQLPHHRENHRRCLPTGCTLPTVLPLQRTDRRPTQPRHHTHLHPPRHPPRPARCC